MHHLQSKCTCPHSSPHQVCDSLHGSWFGYSLSTPLTCATPVPDSVARYHTHAVGPNQCCSAAVHHIAAPVSTVWSVVRRFDDPLTSQFATLNDLCYELSSLQDLASRGSWRSILDQVARARKLSLLPKPGGATTTTTSSPPSHHPKWTPSTHRKTNKPETRSPSLSH
ncbi:unnamed protein product [Camellia sinensis]